MEDLAGHFRSLPLCGFKHDFEDTNGGIINGEPVEFHGAKVGHLSELAAATDHHERILFTGVPDAVESIAAHLTHSFNDTREVYI